MFQSRETKANLEQCEKMYIEKFKSLIVDENENKQFTEFIKKKINQYKIFNDYPLNVWYFVDVNRVITYPLISLSNYDTFYNFYKLINIGDEISIWGSIKNNGKLGHLTVVIRTIDGYLFSFGFGINIKHNENVILTPDYVFEHKIIEQINFPNNRYIKLIAKTKLNKNNLIDITKLFSNFTIKDFLGCNKKYYNIKDLTTSENEKKNEFNLYSFRLKYNVEFCKYASSRKGNKTMNCASFVEKLLGDIITCTGSSLVTNPNWCHQRSTVKSTPCK